MISQVQSLCLIYKATFPLFYFPAIKCSSHLTDFMMNESTMKSKAIDFYLGDLGLRKIPTEGLHQGNQ